MLLLVMVDTRLVSVSDSKVLIMSRVCIHGVIQSGVLKIYLFCIIDQKFLLYIYILGSQFMEEKKDQTISRRRSRP